MHALLAATLRHCVENHTGDTRTREIEPLDRLTEFALTLRARTHDDDRRARSRAIMTASLTASTAGVSMMTRSYCGISCSSRQRRRVVESSFDGLAGGTPFEIT